MKFRKCLKVPAATGGIFKGGSDRPNKLSPAHTGHEAAQRLFYGGARRSICRSKCFKWEQSYRLPEPQSREAVILVSQDTKRQQLAIITV